jgi:hypothetical protein
MKNKIVLISVLVIALLTGVIFALSGAGIIKANPIISLSKPTNSSSGHTVDDSSKSQKVDARMRTVQPEQQSISNNEAPLSAALNYDRAERWHRAKKAPALEQMYIDLINDGDIESPSFGLYINQLCMSVKGIEKGEASAGKILRELTKGIGIEMSDASIANSYLLGDKFSVRCGNLGNERNMAKATEAVKKAGAAGSVLASSLKSPKVESDAEFAALNIVLRRPELAAVWLAERNGLFRSIANGAGYLDELTRTEKIAVIWTVICNFGGDCADDGASRLDACFSSYLCDGNSVAEAVASAVGKEKVPIIAARANKLGLDLAAAGSDFFKQRPKY